MCYAFKLLMVRRLCCTYSFFIRTPWISTGSKKTSTQSSWFINTRKSADIKRSRTCGKGFLHVDKGNEKSSLLDKYFRWHKNRGMWKSANHLHDFFKIFLHKFQFFWLKFKQSMVCQLKLQTKWKFISESQFFPIQNFMNKILEKHLLRVHELHSFARSYFLLVSAVFSVAKRSINILSGTN